MNKLEEKLEEDEEVDIYMELSENIDKYIQKRGEYGKKRRTRKAIRKRNI